MTRTTCARPTCLRAPMPSFALCADCVARLMSSAFGPASPEAPRPAFPPDGIEAPPGGLRRRRLVPAPASSTA